MEKKPQPADGERPAAHGAGTVAALKPAAGTRDSAVRHLPFRSVPAWDIADDEISEWRKAPGTRLLALTAERIRDGYYDNGKEIYPRERGGIYREVSRDTIDEMMQVLAGRGMARNTGGRWYAITPGRMASDTLRAVTVLLASREELPAALAAELGSWKRALDALEAPAVIGRDVPTVGQGAIGKAVAPRALKSAG